MTGSAAASGDIAARRYRERHIESNLPTAPSHDTGWQHVVVIPAYRESTEILHTLQRLSQSAEKFLVIVVANRPQGDADESANEQLRVAMAALPKDRRGDRLYRLEGDSALLFYDADAARGPLPTDEGVGLARKLGCDIAWLWIDQGAISTRWIHCTDADAKLPADYFERVREAPPEAAAAVYPFAHFRGEDRLINDATTRYELRLHHYVLGLEYAGSPYAYHSLGSCIAVTPDAYAMVRGFPRRAAGEDFYLLNKLAKVGPIQRLSGDCVALASRESHRTPFGTGSAVARINRGDLSVAGFYHPQSFEALRAVLEVAAVQATAAQEIELPVALRSAGLSMDLAKDCAQSLTELGWQSATGHCLRHSKNEVQFLRHFHQWFDGFRTLKFIHALRARCLPQLSLEALEGLQPRLWPDGLAQHQLVEVIRAGWGWTMPDQARW